MPNSPDLYRVMSITSNAAMLDQIRSALSKEQNYFLIDHQGGDAELMEAIDNLKPNCVLLDYLSPNANPLDLIDSISLQFPDMRIVVILPDEKMAEANRVMLAGARAFIGQPFSNKELLDTLGHLREITQRIHRSKTDAGLEGLPMASRGTFVVFSPKGGVGCSTVAINLAIAMKELLGEEILLMDAKLLFGDLDIMLNLKSQNSITDLVPHIGSLDEGLIRAVVSEHVSGVNVLPAPVNPISAQGIHPEELHRILTSVQNIYPNIIIDGGNFLNENVVTIMDSSHKVILVISPEIACLRDASRFFDICQTTLSFPKERIHLIVNQHERPEALGLDIIERSLQVKAFATLPWDPRLSLQSINRGVPVIMQAQNNPMRKAFQVMAKKLAAIIGHTEGFLPEGKKTLPEVLWKSSRLG